MAKKTYRTYFLKGLQLLLPSENGNFIEVNFRGGVQVDSTAKFSTSDEKLQEAMEKCDAFDRDFYLESVSEEKAAEKPAAKKEEPKKESGKQTVKVSDKAAAIEWLKEHNPEAGYTAYKLKSKEAFEAACKECGVVFEY